VDPLGSTMVEDNLLLSQAYRQNQYVYQIDEELSVWVIQPTFKNCTIFDVFFT
jgi:hypothetical protein